MASYKGKPPSRESLILLHLRSRLGWTQRRLADQLGWVDRTQISGYETGEHRLSREHLLTVAGALGYQPVLVDALLDFHRWLEPLEPREPASPLDPTPEELNEIHQSSLAATAIFLDGVRNGMIRKKREQKAEVDRRRARELWTLLKATPRQDQRDQVTAFPAFRNWALAVHVCEASVRAAAHKPDEALHLADLAVLIATRSPGGQSWRSRLEGFCWAFLANARRVANDFAGADKAFARTWELWQAGAASDPDPLPEWRMLDLEASLRREQHRFPEALELLTRAKAGVGGNPVAAARMLLKKEHILELMGDIQGALAVLLEATPFVEASKDSRLQFALFFNTADNLCQIKQYEEAEEQLNQARETALKQGNELDLVRVVWLEARLIAGQGRINEAIASLEKVRQDFTARELPYDAALTSLDLAALWLGVGRTAEVRDLARTMAWIFQAQGISREALAALVLFRDAAQRETATVEMVQQVISEIKNAKRSAPLAFSGQRGRR